MTPYWIVKGAPKVHSVLARIPPMATPPKEIEDMTQGWTRDGRQQGEARLAGYLAAGEMEREAPAEKGRPLR